MEYMLFSTEKYIFFQSRNPGIWAFPIPVFGIEKNVRDPCILDPGITPYSELVRYRPTRNSAKAGFFAFSTSKKSSVAVCETVLVSINH